MFWIDCLDTGLIENESISHHAWILDGDMVIIQGEHLRYGEDPIFYYDVHKVSENGNLSWIRREVDKASGTEIQDVPDTKKILLKGDPKGPAKFKAKMERYSRWKNPPATEWDPEVYWLEIVKQYPARYIRSK